MARNLYPDEGSQPAAEFKRDGQAPFPEKRLSGGSSDGTKDSRETSRTCLDWVRLAPPSLGALWSRRVGLPPAVDGKTLNGWTIQGLPKDKALAAKAWTVDQGTFLANTIGHRDHFYIMLVSEKEYGDFILRLRIQVERGVTGNSGIQIRSRYGAETGWKAHKSTSIRRALS